MLEYYPHPPKNAFCICEMNVCATDAYILPGRWTHVLPYGPCENVLRS